jgi:hypothetical protein
MNDLVDNPYAGVPWTMRKHVGTPNAPLGMIGYTKRKTHNQNSINMYVTSGNTRKHVSKVLNK